MQKKYAANEYRSTLIYVDSYENCELHGRICHPTMPGSLSFDSMMHFLLQMEELLDGMNFPQSFTAKRSFAPSEFGFARPQMGEERQGRLASFVVKILFRQNASWQGNITWLNESRNESFRSVLELLMLMHSVLTEERGEAQSLALLEK